MLIYCQYAWLPEGVVPDVVLETRDGRLTRVSRPQDHVDLARSVRDMPDKGVSHPQFMQDQRTSGGQRGSGVVYRAGVTMAGFANAHSHAFHRALRGRTHGDRGSFWTWREQMYRVAAALDPDSYYRLARGVYGEMALAGITSVGEFHYLHHAPGGVPYANPNAMGEALVAAAKDAGLRITLLDTLYLTASVDGKPLEGPQLRFGDGDALRWAERVDLVADQPHLLTGAAIHSVRAVPPAQMSTVAAWAAGRPLHAHVSEQRAENEACLAEHGRTPTEVLADFGAVHEMFTAVHATHLTHNDMALLSASYACFCPTTERDLGDGIGPARALADAGTRLTLGSDSHAVIDFFEESRALELHERLATEQRGHFTAAELRAAATAAGHASLGWHDAGRIEVGARADLVTVALDSPRTAGIDPEGMLFAASPADITHVLADGREVVRDGRHTGIDVARELQEAITCLF
ncbi:formimidoylglutamate deiminase [Saccharothrix algeriensis]|uniref:Formimidoylglutamate deiminase n=1 Tax=Catellatospora bangladeshensis TaxID=310355 RepID=A0A8J3JHL4_9ACTN|nr:formimidoylglutamate deiminase [Catellatospora bangladeshensis]GIF84771.1 formimidoylglutamate deiminase [Catellatospora bangladeshensis]